jgi:Ca-activated chloride channel family protein
MPAQSTGTGNVTAPAAQIDTATARAAQAAADAAQRARMQTRLGDQSGRDAGVRGAAGESHETPAERAERQAVQAQLQRVVDDPGELLRRRFLLEARRREEEGASPP